VPSKPEGNLRFVEFRHVYPQNMTYDMTHQRGITATLNVATEALWGTQKVACLVESGEGKAE